MIGTTLGHYRILDRLGAGGMGVVWLAEDVELGRKVAIKTLRGDVGASPAQLARFQREARAVAALNHANIVTLYSVEEAEGLRFLVMEYVEGGRLDDRIPEKGLPPLEVLKIGAAIADALATAHAHGIVHRDLKPGNVLLTPDGRVKVVDFGLARTFHSASGPFEGRGGDTSMTQDGHAIGTLHYMSPEQLEGKTLDHRSDLFSLGVVLFEMATGERPFYGDSAVQVISSILRDRPCRVDARAARLPPKVSDLIDQLLSKSPGERPDSAAAVRDVLLDATRIFSDETTVGVARSEPSRSRGLGTERQRALRRRRWLAAAAVVAAAALGAALWLGRDTQRTNAPPPPAAAPKIPSIAVLPLANYSGDPEYFVDGMTDGVIGALARIDGLRVISRQSTMHYKGSTKRLPDVAKELGVDYVVEASLRRDQGRLRLEAKLFRPDPEEQVWGETFDRPDPEVLALQTDVARSVAGAVHVPMAASTAGAVPERSVDPQVYESYLRGRALSEQLRPESLAKAQSYFEDALRRDPEFAPAHAGLATVFGLQAYLFGDPETHGKRQRLSAERAIELSADVPEAFVALGNYYLYSNWDWTRGESNYRKGLAINRNNPIARRALWSLLASSGRIDEARGEIEEAVRLDPLSAASGCDLGYQRLFESRYEEARTAFDRALELDPHYPPAHGGLWLLGDLTDDDPLRVSEMRAWLTGMGQERTVRALDSLGPGAPYRVQAKFAGAQLEALAARERVPLGLGAALLASAGEDEAAARWVKRAFQARDPELIWLARDPSWRTLRDRPDISELISRLKLR